MDQIASARIKPTHPSWGLILTVGLLLIFSSACSTVPTPKPSSPWTYDQLRALDAADQAYLPGDIIALYARETRSEVQIRIDLLDLDIQAQADLWIELDFEPANVNDLTMLIPAKGVATITAPQATQSPSARVIRDPYLDTITISLPSKSLPENAQPFSIRVYSARPGETQIQDGVEANSKSTAEGRVPLVLAFWNTLPAHTPAQALRRWDGAHTGPLGQRHGLVHLLDAVKGYQVPVILLDLKTPLSLAALDILDQRHQAQTLESEGLLMLPDTLPEFYFGSLPTEINQKAAEISHQTALNFQFSESLWNYAPALPTKPLTAYAMTLTREPAPMTGVLPRTNIYRWGEQRVLPLPLENNTTEQITENGLSMDIRRALLAAAIEAQNTATVPIAVLGGDLPHTHWGDADLAPLAIAYIAAHPWIQALNAADLSARPPKPGFETPEQKPMPAEIAPALAALQNAPDSALTQVAWQAALALLAPSDPAPDTLNLLRAQYIGVIGNLLSAAAWERGEFIIPAGSVLQDCSRDSDFDKQPECILATANFFAILDLNGGYLSVAFARTPRGVVQLIGPTSQFAAGLSDSSRWDLSSFNPDPAVIPGALAGPWETHQATLIPNGLRLSAAGVQKDFTITAHGFNVDMLNLDFLTFQIPLAIDSAQRFTPAWAAQFEEQITPQGWSWGTRTGPRALIQTSGSLTSQIFSASLPALQSPENPNFDYGPGYFIPFPMAIVTLDALDSFWVSISVLDNPQ